MDRRFFEKVIPILATVAVVVFSLQVFSHNKADVDLWGNVGFVTQLPGHPGFHTTNTYSYTQPDRPWINHEWLSEYILHIVHTAFGNAGLLALKTLIGLFLVFMMNRVMEEAHVGGKIRFFYLLLIISTMGYGFSTRPHLFTYVVLALFLYLLKGVEDCHSGFRRCVLWPLPLLGLLWTNLHGAFFIGIVVTAVFAFTMWRPGHCGRCALTLRLMVPVLLIVSLVNPYGWRTWAFIFESAGQLRPYLSEWAPFHPVRDFYDHVDFMVLTAISLVCVMASARHHPLPWVVLFVLSLIAALAMRRNIPLFALVCAFTAAPHVGTVAGRGFRRLEARMPPALSALALMAFIILSATYGVQFNRQKPYEIEVPRDRFPVDTVALMKAHGLSGNALVFFDWAEYCIWHLYPDCRVFMDGRFRSAYGPQVVEDYLNFLYMGPEWSRALTVYPTDIVLVHTGNPVYKKMTRRRGWTLAHETGIAALFVKTDTHQAYLDALRATPSLSTPAIPVFP